MRDRAAILALNNAHAAQTSLLTAERLDALLGMACHVGLVDAGRTAFLLGFDQAAAYDSPNFRWFQARYARFAYVDRIVVAAPGQGHGRALYAEFSEHARQAGYGGYAARSITSRRTRNPTRSMPRWASRRPGAPGWKAAKSCVT